MAGYVEGVVVGVVEGVVDEVEVEVKVDGPGHVMSPPNSPRSVVST